MLRYLGMKFWIRIAVYVIVVTAIVRGPKVFNPVAETLTFDEVSTGAAKSIEVPVVQPEHELRLEAFLTSLDSSTDGRDWRWLHEEWIGLTEQWFTRLFPPHEQTYSRYVMMWVDKREKARQWRLDCRHEFFPEFSDEELFARLDWFQEQDEWREMQAKLRAGEEKAEAQYKLDLQALLGEHHAAFEKLHGIFASEQLGKDAVKDFFL